MVLSLTLVPGTLLEVVSANANDWGFEIQPNVTKVGFNADFNVTVAAVCYAGGADTWQVMLRFDPALLEVVDITRPATLPNPPDNSTPDPYPGEPTINNTAGWVYDGYGVPAGTATVNTSFNAWTIHFRSENATGTSTLNFTYEGAYYSSQVILVGDDYLNWTEVVNGTVMVGIPQLTVNVTPAGKGTVKANGVTLTGYPNTTNWSWDENVTLEAVNSTAGWGFVNWTGDLSGSTNPTSITMANFTQNVTANFAEQPPAISPVPTSLTFSADVGGANPANQTLDICNGGGGTLNWTANITDGNVSWLSMSPMSGTNLTATLCNSTQVAVNTTGLTEGTYHATITITSTEASNTPYSVPVTLHIISPPEEEEIPVELHIESALWEIPVLPAGLSASALSISPQQVKPGEEVTISINVANSGGETGSYNAILYINGAVETSQTVSVAPGMTKNVVFTVSKSDAGVYDVLLAGQSGQFEVVSAGWFGGGLGTGGIVVIVVIVIVLILALVFVLRGTRRAV